MQGKRDYSLDGFRGVAAVSVAIFHFFCAFAPHMVPEYDTAPWPGSDTPLAALYNGGFAVAIFFILSGFVLSRSAARSERPLSKLLLQRYLRLALPVLASALFAWVLLTVWPQPRQALRDHIHSQWLEFVYDSNMPSFGFAVYHGLLGVFRDGNSLLNNALWTMKIELLGSCVIYLVYARPARRFRIPALAIMLVSAALRSHPEYSAFAIGALMHEAQSAKLMPARFAWSALMVGVAFGAMMQGFTQRALALDDVLLPTQLRFGEPHKIWHIMAAAAVMYAVLNLTGVQRVLGSPLGCFLGRISFGLYLVHVPLLYTVCAATYLRLSGGVVMNNVLLLVLYLPATAALGYLFTVLIDEPVVALLRRWGERTHTPTQGRYSVGQLFARHSRNETMLSRVCAPARETKMHTTSFMKVEAFAEVYMHPDIVGTRRLRVLDIGCKTYEGQRSYADIFKRHNADYVGLDVSPGDNVDIVPKDPFVWAELETESFDLCVSGQTFEHNPFFWITFSEIARVLKPGGRAMIVAPGRGEVHRFPVDCWRFYPDAWNALCVYTGLILEESHFEDYEFGHIADGAEWCDSTVVARKPVLEGAQAAKFYKNLSKIIASLPENSQQALAPNEPPLSCLATYKRRSHSSSFSALRRRLRPFGVRRRVLKAL